MELIRFTYSKLILHSLDSNQLGLENQCRATGDRTNTTVTVAELGGNGQSALFANAHVQQTLVPSATVLACNSRNCAPDRKTYPLMTRPVPSLKVKGAWRL